MTRKNHSNWRKKLQFLPYGRSIRSWICLTHKTYTCHTVQNITDTHNIVALYIDGCLGFHDILVYWNESMLYNFRTSNYVQQRKTCMRKAVTVHLNCSTVPCNTLCAHIAVPVWRHLWLKECDVCDEWDAVPSCRHIHANTVHWPLLPPHIPHGPVEQRTVQAFFIFNNLQFVGCLLVSLFIVPSITMDADTQEHKKWIMWTLIL
jgi:hypothetical protein